VSAERITVEAVEVAQVEYDARDRAVVAGQAVIDFTQLGVIVSLLAPREWEEVAAYLQALVGRAPLKDGKAYMAHRTIIGAIASELRGYARLAGEPVGLEVDLRGATSKAEELRIRERIDAAAIAFDRHIGDVIEQTVVQRTYDEAHRESDDPSGVDALMDAATHRALSEEDERAGQDEQEDPVTLTITPAAATTPTADELAAWS
jgi:hypothetical protein